MNADESGSAARWKPSLVQKTNGRRLRADRKRIESE